MMFAMLAQVHRTIYLLYMEQLKGNGTLMGEEDMQLSALLFEVPVVSFVGNLQHAFWNEENSMSFTGENWARAYGHLLKSLH